MKPISLLAFDSEFVGVGNIGSPGRIAASLRDHVNQQVPSPRLSYLRQRTHNRPFRLVISRKARHRIKGHVGESAGDGSCQIRLLDSWDGGSCENPLRLGNDCVRCPLRFGSRVGHAAYYRRRRIGISCRVGFQCTRQHCRKNRCIRRIEVDDARSRVGAADGIVAKEIQHGRILERRRSAAVPKF